jgi:hypothetical protein
MFISKDTMEEIITECIDDLSSQNHLRSLDDEVWEGISDRMRRIIHKRSFVDLSKYNDLKLAGIQRAKEQGLYKGRQSRFTEDEFTQMRDEFETTKNKKELAEKWGISRAYLYQVYNKK